MEYFSFDFISRFGQDSQEIVRNLSQMTHIEFAILFSSEIRNYDSKQYKVKEAFVQI